MSTVFDARYFVRVVDSSGNTAAFYDNFVSVYYKAVVNSPGIAILTVAEGHPILSTLVDDLLIEIKYGYPNGNQYTYISSFLGLYRDKQVATDEHGNIYHVLYFPGVLDIFSRVINAYYAEFNNMTKYSSVGVATIMYTLVLFNCITGTFVTNNRLRVMNTVRPIISPSTIAPGLVIDYRNAYRNILESLQELAKTGSIDFELTLGTSPYVNYLFFNLHAGQLGSDKSASMIFNLNLHNLGRSALNGDRLSEKTVAIVGGSGEGSRRMTAVRTGVNFSTSNDYELFVDDRTSTTTAQLQASGDIKLAEVQAKSTIDASILQSAGYMYGRDYVLGDLVSVQFAGVTAVKKIQEIEVRFAENGEAEIQLGMIDA